MHRTGIWGTHWFIQQIFIEHIPCAWHPILNRGDTMVNPTGKEGPSSHGDDMASYAKLRFTHTVWIFSCPQFSALEDVPSIFQLLVWNLLPVNEVIFWGTERDYTHSVYKSRGGKSSCRLLKICTDIQAWLTQSWAPAQECAVSTTTILHKNPH